MLTLISIAPANFSPYYQSGFYLNPSEIGISWDRANMGFSTFVNHGTIIQTIFK